MATTHETVLTMHEATPLIPPRPVYLTVKPDSIPQHLRELPRWVCWNYLWNGKKWTKPPYMAGTTHKALSNNPKTWSDFETALSAYQSGKGKHDGIGIIPPDGMTGIDIDDCRDLKTGELTPLAQTILGEFDTFTEASVSGTGIHLFFMGRKPTGRCRHTAKGVEIYDGGGGRYFTFTGHVLHDAPIASRQEELDCLHAKIFPPVSTPVNAPRAPSTPSNMDDSELIEFAKRTKNGWKFTLLWNGDYKGAGFVSQSEADLCLCGTLAWLAGGDASRIDSLFRQSGFMRPKWDELHGTQTYGAGTVEKGISGCNGEYYKPQKRRTTPQSKPNGETPSEISATPVNSTQEDARVTVEVNPTKNPPENVVAEAILNLAAYNNLEPRIFWRGSSLCRVDFDSEGRPGIVALEGKRGADSLKISLAASSRFVSTSDDRGTIPVNPPQYAVDRILAQPEYPNFPLLDGITTAPTFAADGSLCDKPGYNHATRKYYHAQSPLVIPEMTVEEARSLILDDVLGDFPFTDTYDASRAHAVSLMLLPFVKNMIVGETPLHLIDAPASGTGKTYLVNACTSPFLGGASDVRSAPTDEEEWEKRIATALMGAPSHVVLDNIKGVLDSASLEAALTSPTFKARLLGFNKEVSLKTGVIWVLTSNQSEISVDLARRSVYIRIDAEQENPAERAYKHPELIDWIRDNRGRVVGACLTLIGAWINKGKPVFTGRRAKSFGKWSDVMGGILEVAGIPGFLENVEEMKEQVNDAQGAWRGLVLAWSAKHSTNKVSTRELFELAKDYLESEISTNDENKMRAKFGRLIKKKRDVTFGGWKITSAGRGSDGAGQAYKLVKVSEKSSPQSQETAPITGVDLGD